MISACVIVVGNEILSGRTKDSNLVWLAEQLNSLGIRLLEARVIPDVEAVIIKTINECRVLYDYIFTTGGIGPTHDDITSLAVAKAFGVSLIRHAEAERRLTQHYGAENLNAARLKMAEIPEKATLIDNPVSAAPGFLIENVYVMAGVPRIMQAMFDGIKHSLKGGEPMLSLSISVYLTEGVIAEALTEIQNRHLEVEIGSYPFIKHSRLGTSLVCRHTDAKKLAEVEQEILAMIKGMQGELVS